MPATTPEMNDLARRYLAALAGRDTDSIMTMSVDDESTGYLGIHSLPGFVDWSLESAVARLKPLPPSQLAGSSPHGWYEGDVAWFVDFPRGVLPDGTRIGEPLRATLVMRRVNGTWKTVQWHISESVPRPLTDN